MSEKKRHRRGRKKKKTAGNIISTIVMIIAIGVLLYSGFQLVSIYGGRYKGDREYNGLKDLALEETAGEGEDGGDGPRFKVNFDELREVNGDIKAWIRFDEPAIISYPVVQGRDNEIYLHKTISGYANTYGAIFIEAANKPDFSDRNTIIYGHRMNSDSMFGQLDKYSDKAFWEKYPYFYIYTPDGAEHVYKVAASGTVHMSADVYRFSFGEEADFTDYLAKVKGIAEYDTGVELSKDSQIVTLSTCTRNNDNNRYVVCGVRVESRRPGVE